MREILERLLQSVDVPNVERAQLHWDEYRTGAGSTDPAVKAAADAAFATLLAWYGAALYRHIWGFIRTDAAEDVFQDVLRKLHEKRLSTRLADFHANVLPWLRTVAIRECVDAHRRTARRRGRETRAARPEQHPSSDNPGELQEVLSVALARLTPKEQQAIALHYFEGHDKQQTAAILGVNRDTLSTRLNAALDRLQRFIPAPTTIVVGGTLTAPAILTARPPTLTATRLSELVAAAWDKATEAGWLTGRAAAAAIIGLTLCGAAATAGWALTRESARPVEVRFPPRTVNEPREPLRERYLRIANAEVVPRALVAIQKLLPPDNRVSALEPRVNGSMVEVEFRPARPIPGFFTDRILVRYDVLTGNIYVLTYVVGERQWYSVTADSPYTFPVPTLTGSKAVTTTPFRSSYAEVHEAFRQIPPDDRAEEEQVRHLFGEHGWTGREFTIPSTAHYVFGNSRTLFVWFAGMGNAFSRQVDGGGWRYAGILPAWPLGVDETHFYYATAPDRIFSRRIDDPQGAWERIRARTQPTSPETWLTPADRAHLKWPTRGDGLPRSPFLAVWGNRLLHIPGEPGPIQSRSLSDSEAPWVEIGSVHVPKE
jgi:RNA polymerase sigma factor (sigma-70 family)